jgi:hypothetical protein
MPATSSLYQQAADIGYTTLQASQNGQVNAQNQKIYIGLLATAVVQLAQCVNNMVNSSRSITAASGLVSANIAADLTPAVGTATTGRLVAPVTANAATFLAPNYVGPIGGSDPVAFDGVGGLNTGIQNWATGATGGGAVVAVQQP